jgi:hypothetical protein
MRRLALLATLVALVLPASGCAGGDHASPAKASPTRRLADLRDVGQLRSLFNTRSGEPRLIVLVSPT